MKRSITYIDNKKWYHLETLKKYYIGYNIEFITNYNNENKAFNFVVFRKTWRDISFIIHPKTKRLKFANREALEELGFYSKPVAIE